MTPTPPARVRGMHPDLYVDESWLARRVEPALDPHLPIVDPHHHLWGRASPYWASQLADDMCCGHDVRATVYVEAGSMYRRGGDPRFASIGEVEFANDVAEAFAGGAFGALRACAGIVGRVDLREGAAVEDLLDACIAAAPQRLRGVRNMAALDADPAVSRLAVPPPADLMLDRRFREGFARLAPRGLCFDAYCYHPQLLQLLDLVDAFPDTTFIVDHCGALVGQGGYAQRRAEAFDVWRTSMRSLALRPNVNVKLGGLAGRLAGHRFIDDDEPPCSEALAQAWRPVIETCIEAFGPGRAMFESNFPPDKCGVSAGVLWNAFKRIVQGCSTTEREQLFAGTAIRVYRLPEAFGRRP